MTRFTLSGNALWEIESNGELARFALPPLPCGQSAKMPKFTLCVRDACGYNSADETGGDGCAVRRP